MHRSEQENVISHRKRNKVSTNWFVIDLGFANHDDRTDYTTAEAQNFVHGQAAGHPSQGKQILV